MTLTSPPIVIPKYAGSTGPRFDNHDWYVKQLSKLADSWCKYLKHYLETTKDLFGNAELPWGENERVLVSSLAAAIMFCNQKAITVEELPVKKTSGTTRHGRCDLWAHIPNKPNDGFSFYMEAKKFKIKRNIEEIEKKLSGPYGISRMLDDYAKSRGGERFDQRSAYRQETKRRHTHCVIGLICMPLTGINPDNLKDVETEFKIAYTKEYPTPNGPKRLIQRYPTVGFVFTANNKAGDAMLVGMTVLGE